MKDEREKRKRDLQMAVLFFAILWVFVMLVASAMAYIRHEKGTATLPEAFNAIAHFRVFYWMNPVTWGTCIRWTLVYVAFAGMFMIYQQKYHHDAAGKEAGSAHWNNRVEEYNKNYSEPFGDEMFSDAPGISEKNLNNPKSPPVPGNPNMIESQTVRLSTADMKTHLNNNVFIVGGAGTGKSRFFIKPNILQMNCSYVVTDPSGELLKSMHNVLADNGYRIKVFNLVDMTHSCKYNPFRYIKSETDVSILVDCFISNTTAPDQRSSDPFWDKSEKALLTALIFYLRDIAGEEFQMFSTVLWMVQLAQMSEEKSFGGRGGGGANAEPHFEFTLDNTLDELFNGTRKIVKKTVKNKDGDYQEVLEAEVIKSKKEIEEMQNKIETSLCLTNYKTFKLGGTKTLKSILISAAVRLNPFSIPAIKNLTSEDNVGLENVGDELTCLFAIIPQTNNTFNFLVSMLFSQMFEALYYEGSTISNSRLNYHVRFLLDEFANIGKIPEFPQKISTCRKYNISTTIVLQSIAQIKMLYKDDYETIIGNCDTAICLGTNEQTTADYFSKKLGKSTITARSRSMQVGKSGGSMSFQQTGRELMTPDEIMTMPYDECIVMMNHISPFYDKKYALENHPQFKNTGDGDESNFYYLESDPDFLIVDSTPTMQKQNVEDTIAQPKKFEPKNMKETLEKLLQNNPEKDRYYLIKSPDESQNRKIFSLYLDKARKAVDNCISENYKSPFFEGENMDPGLLSPVATKIMTEYDGKITDFMVSCLAVKETEHMCVIGAEETRCNAVRVTDRMSLKRESAGEHEDPHFVIWSFSEPLSLEKYGNVTGGCRQGAEAVEIEDDDDDYYGDF